MENVLIKGLAFDKKARIFFINNTELLKTICCRPAVKSQLLRHVLGLTVSAASLLVGTLKEQQRLSLKIQTSHSAHKLFADVDSLGNVRGYASDDLLKAPAESLDKMTIPQFIGDTGFIQIAKDVGMFRSFTGITDMPYRNIVDDLSHYFHQSEQTPTCFALHIVYTEDGQVQTSVGMLAQLLPGASKGLMGDIKEAIKPLPEIPPSKLNGETFGQVPFLFFKENIEIKEAIPVRAYCGCSKEMMISMLYSLGKEELNSACGKDDSIEVVCRGCGQSYLFEPHEIKKLLD